MLVFKHNNSQGFTIVELIVVVGLIAMLAAMGVPSFRNWREMQDLTAAQREMVTNLQKARSHALSGRRMGNYVSKYYVMRLVSSSPTIYTIEGVAYNASGSADIKFNGVDQGVLESWKFPGGVAIKTLEYERPVGTGQTDPSCILVGFALPYGNTYIDTNVADGIDDDGVCDFFNKYPNSSWLAAWSNAKVTITLARPGSSLSKAITINAVTGQIQAN